MATQCIISFSDNRQLGTMATIKALIQTQFPDVKFYWTTSGLEKLRLAKERGIEFPPVLREGLESLPSLFEGVAEGAGWRIDFGLNHLDPVRELVMEAQGEIAAMDNGLRAIEKALGSTFRIQGEPATE